MLYSTGESSHPVTRGIISCQQIICTIVLVEYCGGYEYVHGHALCGVQSKKQALRVSALLHVHLVGDYDCWRERHLNLLGHLMTQERRQRDMHL